MNKRVLVVDLDKTLYKCNTFHYFIRYVFINAIKKFDVILLFKIKLNLAFRLFNLLSHAKMKYNILNSLKHKKINYDDFVSSLNSKKNNLKFIDKSSFDYSILATAAPFAYAKIIADNEGFNACLATHLPKNGFFENFENIKENKKNSVEKYLEENNLKGIDTLVTDHIDDLPLIKIAKNNFIVSPNKHLLKTLDSIEVNYKIVG